MQQRKSGSIHEEAGQRFSGSGVISRTEIDYRGPRARVGLLDRSSDSRTQQNLLDKSVVDLDWIYSRSSWPRRSRVGLVEFLHTLSNSDSRSRISRRGRPVGGRDRQGQGRKRIKTKKIKNKCFLGIST